MASMPTASSEPSSVLPPECVCKKQKTKAALIWQEIYVKIEGHACNFYDKRPVGEDEVRPSSIPDVRGCEVITGVEPFTFGKDQFRITLRRQNHPNGLDDLG
eukprot:COSAG06_NODE_15686_length_1052_cov_10.818419_2_plen_101_part_01